MARRIRITIDVTSTTEKAIKISTTYAANRRPRVAYGRVRRLKVVAVRSEYFTSKKSQIISSLRQGLLNIAFHLQLS